MDHITHPANWNFGWWLLLASFLAGAVLGLAFHKADFLGGYASWRRRLLRLGHIAMAALGMLNLFFALSPYPSAGTQLGSVASHALMTGAVAMPLVCFLAAWREPFRHLFFIPVILLAAAVAITAFAGGFS